MCIKKLQINFIEFDRVVELKFNDPLIIVYLLYPLSLKSLPLSEQMEGEL